jgi:hypothetical protein
LRNKHSRYGFLNQAVLWHLQLCLRLLDRLGYQMSAVNVAAAIDSLISEAATEDEISKMDVDHGHQARLMLDIFEKHGQIHTDESEASDRGQFRDGNTEET